MRVDLTPRARDDLRAIGDYIAEDNPARAVTFVQELLSRCSQLADRPSLYPYITPGRHPGVRRCLHGPYMIFYRVLGDSIVVIRIVHGRRDYAKLLPRR